MSPEPSGTLVGLAAAAIVLTLPFGPGITAGLGIVVVCLAVILVVREVGLDPDRRLPARVITIPGPTVGHALVIGVPPRMGRMDALVDRGWTVIEPPLDLTRDIGAAHWQVDLRSPTNLTSLNRGARKLYIDLNVADRAALHTCASVVMILTRATDLPNSPQQLVRAGRARLLFSAVADIRT